MVSGHPELSRVAMTWTAPLPAANRRPCSASWILRPVSTPSARALLVEETAAKPARALCTRSRQASGSGSVRYPMSVSTGLTHTRRVRSRVSPSCMRRWTSMAVFWAVFGYGFHTGSAPGPSAPSTPVRRPR